MSRKQIIKPILVLMALIAIAAAAFYAIHVYDNRSTGGKYERQESAPDPMYLYLNDLEFKVDHNIKTYLVIGTDGNGSKPNAKKYHGPMSDYLLLLVIDKTAEQFGFVQIDRDTMTEVTLIGTDGDEEGAAIDEMQICTASWYGKDIEQGLGNVVYSASYLLGGIEIDGYYSINMDDIATLNHAVGGVTVTIEDDMSDIDEEMKPGATIHLNDDQAVTFVRTRKTVGDGTNESRMRRQRVYMDALMDQVKEKMKSDKSFANDLYKELKSIAVTDIPGNRISAISNLMYKYKSLGIKDITGKHKLGRVFGDEQDYVQFYADEASMVEIFQELCGIGEGNEY